MPVDPNQFDQHTASIIKRYGRDAIRTGAQQDRVYGIPFGSLELDWMTSDAFGNRGIRIGRWARLWGGPMSGKSLTAWNVIKNAQNIHHIMEELFESQALVFDLAGEKTAAKEKRDELKRFLDRFPEGMRCAYYNIEKQYHKDFVAQHGIDLDSLIVFDGTIIEQIGDVLESTLGSIHLHVLDSCSSGVPNEELEIDTFEQRRGLAPRTWGRMFRRAMERFDYEANTVLLIDQARINLQTGAEEAPGGKFMEHTSSQTIHFNRGKWLYRDNNGNLTDTSQTITTLSGNKEPDGIELQTRVVKSRVSKPFRTARTRLGFDNMRFDTTWELMKAGVHHGIIGKSGHSWYVVGDQKFQGQKGIREFIDSNAQLKKEIIDARMASV